MKIQYKKIKTGEIPGLDVTMPYLVIGQGRPLVSILAGVHGGEESGLLIIKKVLEALYKVDITGTIQIFPSCNLLAQAFKTRVVNGFDYADLNRSFPGNQAGSYTQRTAAAIFNLVKDSDWVLDLHTFTMLCPLVGILTKSGSSIKDKKALKMLRLMDVDLIWDLDIENSDSAYMGTLGNAFAGLKGSYLCLETSNICRLTVPELNRAVQAILNLLSVAGVIDKSSVKKNNSSIPVVKRVDQKADAGGLFLPVKNILTQVKIGEVIGEICSLQDFKAKPIVAQENGLVIMIRDKSLVSTGDKIISFGKPV